MFATLFAAALAVAGGAAWAQSTATPDTALGGISTGAGFGATGAGHGQSGTSQLEGGLSNTSRPALGMAGDGAGRPSTGDLPPWATLPPDQHELPLATPNAAGAGGDQHPPYAVEAR